MRALVIANGTLTTKDIQRERLGSFDLVIAADGGYRHCQTLGIKPDAVIGDLDSLTSAERDRLERSEVSLITRPPDKDEIDLELALLHARQNGAKEIHVLAGLGGRFDMSLANLSLLTHPELEGTSITFHHKNQKIWLIRPPGAEIEGASGDTLSLLPFGGAASGITTTHLAYPLHDEVLALGPARGVSNVLTSDNAKVALEQGMLLAVWTRGKA